MSTIVDSKNSSIGSGSSIKYGKMSSNLSGSIKSAKNGGAGIEDELNNLNIKPSSPIGKNGYPSYQATVASMTSHSAANSTGAVTALLSSVSLSLDGENGGGGGGGGFGETRPPLSSSYSLSSERPTSSGATIQNRLDNYELLTTVGTGTFGRVIVVRNKINKNFYALKIMSIAEVLRLKQTEHVKNEKEILLQINHPFIINL
jgi:hypothetical protein